MIYKHIFLRFNQSVWRHTCFLLRSFWEKLRRSRKHNFYRPALCCGIKCVTWRSPKTVKILRLTDQLFSVSIALLAREARKFHSLSPWTRDINSPACYKRVHQTRKTHKNRPGSENAKSAHIRSYKHISNIVISIMACALKSINYGTRQAHYHYRH